MRANGNQRSFLFPWNTCIVFVASKRVNRVNRKPTPKNGTRKPNGNSDGVSRPCAKKITIFARSGHSLIEQRESTNAIINHRSRETITSHRRVFKISSVLQLAKTNSDKISYRVVDQSCKSLDINFTDRYKRYQCREPCTSVGVFCNYSRLMAITLFITVLIGTANHRILISVLITRDIYYLSASVP